jgi:myo-inositol catabolism protein IolC/endonuclease YncB( thermonuclease family)
MALGYDGKLYILAFDHRGSFQKKMFGIDGVPTPEQTETISDAKRLIFEGMELAAKRGVDPKAVGVLVDEQFGSDIPTRAKSDGLQLAMPAEKSGQNEFDFEYGDDFGAHIEANDPDFTKVLVRLNPEDEPELNKRQLDRLKRLADWLHDNDRKFLFELLVPATDEQLAAAGGDSDRYDAEQRPELMRRAIEEIQDHGVKVDIWKIEGVDAREDAQMLIEQTRKGEGNENVVSVLLGRGASNEKVDHWLQQAAPVDGFVGFAIGRSIWWDALKGFLDGSIEREAAAEQIAVALIVVALLVGSAINRDVGSVGKVSRTPDPRVAQVVEVVDGDTITVRFVSGTVRTVRYIGVDAPDTPATGEDQQCWGASATRANEALIPPGERVRLEYDDDRKTNSGALLAYVFRARDELFVQAALLHDGEARILTTPPNVRHVRRFISLANDARENRRGLWGACSDGVS